MSAFSRLPDDDREPTVSIWWLQRQLGKRDYKDRRLVSYLTLLIDELGFPPPLPDLVLDRRPADGGDRPLAHSVTRKVTTNSRWRRDAVDAWLEDYLPPDNAAALDARARAGAADDMDRNAGNLRLVAGRGA